MAPDGRPPQLRQKPRAQWLRDVGWAGLGVAIIATLRLTRADELPAPLPAPSPIWEEQASEEHCAPAPKLRARRKALGEILKERAVLEAMEARLEYEQAETPSEARAAEVEDLLGWALVKLGARDLTLQLVDCVEHPCVGVATTWLEDGAINPSVDLTRLLEGMPELEEAGFLVMSLPSPDQEGLRVITVSVFDTPPDEQRQSMALRRQHQLSESFL